MWDLLVTGFERNYDLSEIINPAPCPKKNNNKCIITTNLRHQLLVDCKNINKHVPSH